MDGADEKGKQETRLNDRHSKPALGISSSHFVSIKRPNIIIKNTDFQDYNKNQTITLKSELS